MSFFFSGSETALTASSRARMMRLEKNGNRSAAIVNRLMQMRERLIGTILFGNNLVNIAASALATGILLDWFGEVGVIYATLVDDGRHRRVLRDPAQDDRHQRSRPDLAPGRAPDRLCWSGCSGRC